jgi:hypothetical protein
MKSFFFYCALFCAFIAAFVWGSVPDGRGGILSRLHFGWAAAFFWLLSVAPFVS